MVGIIIIELIVNVQFEPLFFVYPCPCSCALTLRNLHVEDSSESCSEFMQRVIIVETIIPATSACAV
jgi:hypothetical protein